ncbi:hypothetical protein Bbelb_137150 [Branchiostoma belcheri]|nr:hypothetical protein Bbelb_137150 [Branchiostoma belcheri]
MEKRHYLTYGGTFWGQRVGVSVAVISKQIHGVASASCACLLEACVSDPQHTRPKVTSNVSCALDNLKPSVLKLLGGVTVPVPGSVLAVARCDYRGDGRRPLPVPGSPLNVHQTQAELTPDNMSADQVPFSGTANTPVTTGYEQRSEEEHHSAGHGNVARKSSYGAVCKQVSAVGPGVRRAPGRAPAWKCDLSIMAVKITLLQNAAGIKTPTRPEACTGG